MLNVSTLPSVTRGKALSGAKGRAVTWKKEADGATEEGDAFKGCTGSILVVMMLWVGYTVGLNGEEGPIGLLATGIMSARGHELTEVPLRDLLTHCAALVISQGMRAAASASACAEAMGSPRRGSAALRPRSDKYLRLRRTAR